MQECPHCYNRVMITSNGECPACRKNIRDISEANKDKTAVTIPIDAKIPSCCFVCGQETSRGQKLSFQFEGSENGLSDINQRQVEFSGIIAFLFWPLYKKRLRKSMGHTYEQYIAVCESCKEAAEEVEPLNCLPNAECKLVVHKTFKKNFYKVNPNINPSAF